MGGGADWALLLSLGVVEDEATAFVAAHARFMIGEDGDCLRGMTVAVAVSPTAG